MLRISQETFATRAIEATLAYADVEYTRVTTGDAPGLALCDDVLVRDVPAYSVDADTTFTGWHACFVYASRRAHTWPSDPVHSALVDEAVTAAAYESLVDIQARMADGRLWVVDKLGESTAADFLLLARLRQLQEDGHVLPVGLREYAERDPTCDYAESASEADEGAEEEGGKGTWCSIS